MPVSTPGIEADVGNANIGNSGCRGIEVGAGNANIGNDACCGCIASATAVASRSETLLTIPSGFALLSIDLMGALMMSFSSTGIIALDRAVGCLILR